MLLNISLVFVILSELLGFSPSQEKILFLNSQNNQTKSSAQVLGEKSLPQVSLDSISPYPLADNSMNSATTDAKSAIILDQKTNKILYQKNISETSSIASITKLMTAVVATQDFNMNDNVTVSSDAAYVGGSVVGLYPGEVVNAKELVKGMLIASGNDAAVALEEHYGKDKVVQKMNETAQLLDMKNTHYVEASGLDAGDKSDAKDLAILTRYALQNPIIADAVKTKDYTVASVDGKLQHQIHTTNRLLKNYPDIFGVKTGFTDEAGNCLIAAAEDNGHPIISIVLGVNDYDNRFSESRSLLDWAFNNYKW